MKMIVKILMVILILLLAVAVALTFMNSDGDVQVLDEYTSIIASNSNGTVYKMVCGNNSSDDTAIIILGVHNATNETIMNWTKANDLSKKYIVYFIKLNFNDSGMNISDYDTNRHMGEMLAHDYVLPDIEKYDPFIIVDVHEMESYWEKQRYIGVIDNKSDVVMGYANTINDTVKYPVYTIKGGTSPQWVAVPLEKKGHNVLIFETAQVDSQDDKKQTSMDLIRAIDALPVRK